TSLARHVYYPIFTPRKRCGGNVMQRKLIGALSAAAIIVAVGALAQSQFGTAAEAKAMLEKAVAALKADEAGALAKFNTADGGFRDRDLYVFCYDMATGNFTAHVNKALLGTDVRALKQKDGSPLGEKVYNATQAGAIA